MFLQSPWRIALPMGIFVSITLMFFAPAAFGENVAQLRATIETDKTTYGIGEAIVVKLRVTNSAEEPAVLLCPRPIEGLAKR